MRRERQKVARIRGDDAVLEANGERDHVRVDNVRGPGTSGVSPPTTRASTRVKSCASTVSRNRANLACRLPSRHTCATTGADVRNTAPSSSEAVRKDWAARSPRSTATSTPASRITERSSGGRMAATSSGSGGPASSAHSRRNSRRALRWPLSRANSRRPRRMAPVWLPYSSASSDRSSRSSSLRRTVVVVLTAQDYSTTVLQDTGHWLPLLAFPPGLDPGPTYATICQ